MIENSGLLARRSGSTAGPQYGWLVQLRLLLDRVGPVELEVSGGETPNGQPRCGPWRRGGRCCAP